MALFACPVARAGSHVLVLGFALACAQGSGSRTDTPSAPASVPEGDAPQAESAEDAALGAGEWLDLAEARADEGDVQGQVEAMRNAHELQPWNGPLGEQLAAALAARAKVSFGGGDYQGARAAEADLREAIELSPVDPKLRESLGIVLADLGARASDDEKRATYFEEARALGVEPEADRLEHDPALERRLDLVQDLVERDQLEAAIMRLESLHEERPANPEVALFLSQVLARRGGRLTESGNLLAAAETYEAALRAVQGFEPEDLPPGELERAYRNRVVAWYNARRNDRAAEALAEAEARGMSFPSLRQAVP